MTSSHSSSSRSSSNKKKKPFIKTLEELFAYGRNRTNPNSPENELDPSLEAHTLNKKIIQELFELNKYAFTYYSTNDEDKTYSVEFAIPKNIASKFIKKLKEKGYWYVVFPHNIGDWNNDNTIAKTIKSYYDPNKIYNTYLIRIENSDPNVFDSGRYVVRSQDYPNGWYRDSPTTITFNRRTHFIEDPKTMLVEWSIFDEIKQITIPEVYTELVGVVVEDPKIGRKSLYRELTKILHDINNHKPSLSKSVSQLLKNLTIKK